MTTQEWIDSIAIKNLIYKLPQDEQELLLLRYANDVPIASICKITGLSRFAIYRKTARILKYLKTELQKGGFLLQCCLSTPVLGHSSIPRLSHMIFLCFLFGIFQ